MIFWRRGSLVVPTCPASWVFWEHICISVPPGVVKTGCVRLQWTVLKTQHIRPSHEGRFTSAPTRLHCAEHSAVCDQKAAWPQCPTFRIHPISPSATFLVSLDEKCPQRETFCWCGRDETKKRQTHLKGVKINEFKNCFEQWRKRLDRYIVLNGEYFEGDWIKHVRINTQFFNK